MIVGVPKEVKLDEYRVGMLPVGAEELVRAGHQVLIETDAGMGSGLTNEDYASQGAEIISSRDEIYARADMIVKVKEPLPEEFPHVRPKQILFTFFHFAADRELTDAMLGSGSTCIAYETLTDRQGRLPLLTPMSEVAGRMSIQEGAKYLERPQMGRGILLGGVPGVAPAHITILGGGVVGANAAKIAAGFQADVSILDINHDRLRYLDDIMPPNVNVIYSDRHNIRDELMVADLVVGAVLIPGAKAPRLVEREQLKSMKDGSVIIDVAIDQGGCIETARPTTHSDPTFVVDGVVHYCVANMPGAVGRTSTFALCNTTLSWVLKLANQGVDAARQSPELTSAVNIHQGKVTNEAVAHTFGLPCTKICSAMTIQVGILMGSDSDWPKIAAAADALHEFGVPHEVRVMSAHRTPEVVAEYATTARSRGLRVIIAAAGGSAHLAGVVAAHTTLPVIGLPVPTSGLGGLDSLLSTVQMPADVPVASVAVGMGGPRNAGLFAVQILATADEALAEKFAQFKSGLRQVVAAKDQKLQDELRGG